MKFGDDLYGWGVFDIPMDREPRLVSGSPRQKLLSDEPLTKLLRDVPWKAVGASALMAVLCLIGLLVLDRNSPVPPAPSEPKPVEVAVRIMEEVPIAAPPLAEEVPVSLEEPIKTVIREEPPPAPAEIRPQPINPPPPSPPEKAVRTAPAKPPEPITVRRPPANLQLPPPSPQPARERRPQEQPALPEEKTQVAARQEPVETVLPEPNRSSYEQRPDPAAAVLPERNAALGSYTSAELGEGPQRAHVAERGTAEAPLPESPAMVVGRSDETGLDVAAPRMNARYASRSESDRLPVSLPRGTLAQDSGEEIDVSLPQASAFAVPGSRKAVATLPPGERLESPLAGIGRRADPDLTGPSAQQASLPRVRTQDALGNSYEFLDLVAPEELDRSVMVSLNRLRTCLDPNEELALKSRLAAMLSRPGQCRAGGVVFDVRNPESAYSIHIDLYNYEQRDFPDRCSALRMAVNSCEARR